MPTPTTHRRSFIEGHGFWTCVVILMAFLGGLGLGMRIAVHGIRWILEETANAKQTSLALDVRAEGEIVGQIEVLQDNELRLMLEDGSAATLLMSETTEVFTYSGEQTPLLPGEEREKTNLTLADLQPNDKVVVKYTSEYALTIQKIQ